MRAETVSAEVRAAITRLEGDPFFMASTLANYRAEFRVDNRHLAKTLNCDIEALTALALCRTPDLVDERQFLSDVQTIAKYARCDWKELARVVRTVQALATLKQFTGLPERQLLKAARDKYRKQDSAGKTRRSRQGNRRSRKV